jgi:hypothetical protein
LISAGHVLRFRNATFLNDADLRAGRKYLSVDDRVARHLAELDAPDGSGRVAAARVFRRPDSAQAAGS